MKPTTWLVIGGGALALLFLWSRSSSSSSLLGAPKPPGSTTANLLSFGGGILGGLGAGLLSPGAISGTSTQTSGPASQTTADYTQASNYIADSTASSDTASGVVGFGGWDEG